MTTQSTPVVTGTAAAAQASAPVVSKSVRETSAKVTKSTSGFFASAKAVFASIGACISRYFQVRRIKKDLIAAGQKTMKEFNKDNERATSTEHTKAVRKALTEFEKVLSTVDTDKAIELTQSFVEAVKKEFDGKMISFKVTNGSGTYSMTELMLGGFWSEKQLEEVKGVTGTDTINAFFEQGLLEGFNLTTERTNRGLSNILENKIVQEFADTAVNGQPKKAEKTFTAQIDKGLSAGILDRTDVEEQLDKITKVIREANEDVNGESFKSLVKKAEETLKGNEDGIHVLATTFVATGILSPEQAVRLAETVRERMQNPVAAKKEDDQGTPAPSAPVAPTATWFKMPSIGMPSFKFPAFGMPSFKMPSLFGSKTTPAATTATAPSAPSEEAILDLPVPASTKSAPAKTDAQRLAAGSVLGSAAKKFKATQEEQAEKSQVAAKAVRGAADAAQEAHTATIMEQANYAESDRLNAELLKLISEYNKNVISELKLQKQLMEALEDIAKLQNVIGRKGSASNKFTIDFKLSDPASTSRAKELVTTINQALQGENAIEALEKMIQDLHAKGTEIISQMKVVESKSLFLRRKVEQKIEFIESNGFLVDDSSELDVLEINSILLNDQKKLIQKMVAGIESFDGRTWFEKAKGTLRSVWSKLPSRPSFRSVASDDRFFAPNLFKSRKAAPVQAQPEAPVAPVAEPVIAPVEKTTRWSFFQRKSTVEAAPEEVPAAPAVESIQANAVYNDPKPSVESTTADAVYGEERQQSIF